MSACTAANACLSRPCTATFAPCAANSRTIAAPIPRELPVTSATLPLIDEDIVIVRLHPPLSWVTPSRQKDMRGRRGTQECGIRDRTPSDLGSLANQVAA